MNRRVVTGATRMWVAVAMVLVAFGSPVVLAQSPAAGDQKAPTMMEKMATADQKLAELVAKMNAATGDDKVAAIAAVVTELTAQRRQMHEHGCMQGEKGGMTNKTSAAPNAATDADHTAHQPGK